MILLILCSFSLNKSEFFLSGDSGYNLVIFVYKPTNIQQHELCSEKWLTFIYNYCNNLPSVNAQYLF